MSESIRSINKDKLQEAIALSDTKTLVPPGYVKITYPSEGRLFTPKFLHFKDYRIKDISNLSSKKDKFQTVVSILNDLVYEDFDCSNMHPVELTYTRLMLLRAFYGPVIRDVKVFIDPELPQDKLYLSENLLDVDVDIDSLKITRLPKSIKNGIFTISTDDDVPLKYSFRLSKVKDVLVVDKYLDSIYEEQEQRFSKLKMIAKNYQADTTKLLDNIDPLEYEAYESYYRERELARLEMLRNCQLVCIQQGESKQTFEDEDIEAKLAVEVPFRIWSLVTEHLDKIEFGLPSTALVELYKDGEVLFGKKVERGISFRDSYLIPKATTSKDLKGLSFEFS